MSRGQEESWSLMNVVKNYIHVLPIDRQSKDMIKPFLGHDPTRSIEKIHGSSRTHKRSVSETKKKYIASQQNWKCNHCQQQLTAWFEVDHITRLDQGGTNDVENLVALCRNCHGEKTSMENI
jgi:predicted restriction endonuclease